VLVLEFYYDDSDIYIYIYFGQMLISGMVDFYSTSATVFFIIINIDVQISLRVPQLILQILKLMTM
jgi:hypothetical protein